MLKFSNVFIRERERTEKEKSIITKALLYHHASFPFSFVTFYEMIMNINA
jgi:hypothetical protein